MLVVDNDKITTEHTRMILDEVGVRTDTCTNGEAASAIRALERPDAQTIPIIALTANAFDEDVQQSLQAGMNAHLTKPIESEHLLQTLGELVYEAEQA